MLENPSGNKFFHKHAGTRLANRAVAIQQNEYK